MNENGKKCERARDGLALFIDGQLSSEEESFIQSHLSECGDCKLALQSLRNSWNLLSSLKPADLPAGFEARFWAKTRRQEKPASIIEQLLAWPKWARAAVGIASVSAVWFLGLSGGIASIVNEPVPASVRVLTSSYPKNSIEAAYLGGPLTIKRNAL